MAETVKLANNTTTTVSGYALDARQGKILADLIEQGSNSLPDYTYTGNETVFDDGLVNGVQNWRIKFLTSGTFTPSRDTTVDVFCVGGGGGGYYYPDGGVSSSGMGASGGGGGKTTTAKGIVLKAGTSYSIVIGNGGKTSGVASSATTGQGGTTTAFSVSAEGGKGGWQCSGGNGGSGGGQGYYGDYGTPASARNGASNGQTAARAMAVGEHVNNVYVCGGAGQGRTTREFGETSGTLYAGGGAGGGASGGAGGGGNAKQAGTVNTGGGGGAGAVGHAAGQPTNGVGGNGGSGVVVIRNKR